MQISNLPASNSFSSTDVLPIEINGVTYKVTGATLAAALQTLGNYLTTENVANNLTTTAAGSVLDARQGKALADDVGALSSAMTYVVSGTKSIESVTIPVGAYVRLVDSTIAGRSDGVYTVATAIPVNTVIDGTYFNESAPIPGGLGGAVQQSLAIKTGTETLTTNANGVVALTNIKPGTHVLIAIYVGNGSYGYMRTDSINSDVFGLQVLNMIATQSPTKVANTTLTFTYTYLDLST